MSKNDFLDELRRRLSDLPREEVEERLEFYSEMIDDRIEEGMSEEEATDSIGTISSVADEILSSIPFSSIITHKVRAKRKMSAVTVVLLIVGSPIWLSLLVAAFAVLISLFAALYAVVISLWAAELAIIASAIAGIIGGPLLAFIGNPPAGMMLLACGIVCAGLAIFMFYGMRAGTKGAFILTKKSLLGIKKMFL